MKKILLLLFFLPFYVFSQDDLLEELEASSETEEEVVSAAFKALKIVNLESTKLAAKGDFYLIVSHRFGSVKNGIEDLFGLDDASTRINLVYGVCEGVNIGFSRSKFNKFYEISFKYNLVHQKKNGFPFNIVGYTQTGINTELDEVADQLEDLKFEDRMVFTNQILISRKINKNLSLELAPTVFYEGFVSVSEQEKTQFALGMGGRHKISSRISVNVDYGWHLNRADSSPFKNPLSVGLDFETGGHVFQLHFTNAQAMFESGYLGQASGDWGNGNVFFGFNLNRVF